MVAQAYSCPVCKGYATSEAPPVTRTTARGRQLIVALRRRCDRCGYVDRTTMFRGALSLNYEESRDATGRPIESAVREEE